MNIEKNKRNKINLIKNKDAWDFLKVCETGHLGSTTGYSTMTTVKLFKCNAFADIRDYEQLAVDQKAIDAIVQNSNFKVVFKEGECASIVTIDPRAE